MRLPAFLRDYSTPACDDLEGPMFTTIEAITTTM